MCIILEFYPNKPLFIKKKWIVFFTASQITGKHEHFTQIAIKLDESNLETGILLAPFS
jgi:hypothetical protein